MLYGIKLSSDSDAATAVDTLDAYDLALALDGFSISEPEARTEYVEVRGMDGALDISEAPQGYPTFANRKITFKLFRRPPFLPWDINELILLRTRFMARWQAQRVRIWLPDDPTHYWLGRLSVGPLELGSGLLECEAVVYPYKLKNTPTVVEITDLTTTYKTYTLTNERRFCVPRITVKQTTVLQVLQGPLGTPPEVTLVLPYGDTSATYVIPDTLLTDGSPQLQAKLYASGSNPYMSIEYREGTF